MSAHTSLHDHEPLMGSFGGGGGGGAPPPPTPEEIAAQKSQTELNQFQLQQAKLQAEREEALLPFYIEAAGYDTVPYTGDGTPLTIGGEEYSVVKTPDPLADLNREIAEVSGERLLKAARGELEIDPAVEQDIERGRQELNEELLRRLGPGYQDTESGRRALAEYDRNVKTVRYDVRRGEMSAADALMYNRESAYRRRQDQNQNTLASAAAFNAPSGSALSRASEGFGRFVQQRRDERFGRQRFANQAAAARGQAIGSVIGGGMSAAAMGVAVYL